VAGNVANMNAIFSKLADILQEFTDQLVFIMVLISSEEATMACLIIFINISIYMK
jgi:hypothetical protein